MKKAEAVRQIRLGEIAYARSGDKGSGANIGVIAYTPEGFHFLRDALAASRVGRFFKRLGACQVVRYELPNLLAFNFVIPGVLADGASHSLRVDAQGKALGQALLEMELKISENDLSRCKPRSKNHP